MFQQRYAEALSAADSVVVSAVYAKDNDPLADDERLSTSDLVEQLETGGTKAWQADGPDEILERLTGKLRKGDVVKVLPGGQVPLPLTPWGSPSHLPAAPSADGLLP